MDRWQPEGSAPVTLRLSAGEASRIVRALEATSLSVCGSPSGSRLASSYMRLAGVVRAQAKQGLDEAAAAERR
jgi:hypothetical protein